MGRRPKTPRVVRAPHSVLLQWSQETGNVIRWVRDVGVAAVAILVLVVQILNWLGWRRETAAEATAKLAAQVNNLAGAVVRQDSAQSARLTRSDSINAARTDELQNIARQLSYSVCRLSNNPEPQCLPILIADSTVRRGRLR